MVPRQKRNVSVSRKNNNESLKAGGYLENAAQETGVAWGKVTNFFAKAEAEAKIVTTDAISTTTAFTNGLADTLNKF